METGVLGAALLGAVGTGYYKNTRSTARNINSLVDKTDVDRKISLVYRKKFKLYKRLDKILNDWYTNNSDSLL